MNKLNVLALASVLTLCGCHQDNPLKTHEKRATVAFLMNASANAEYRLHFVIQKNAYGYAYLECMEGKKSPEINCDALYQAMSHFAHEGYYPGFKNLTEAHLQDRTFFTNLADDYAEFAATHEPHLVIKEQS